jgi:hypothetical protein
MYPLNWPLAGLFATLGVPLLIKIEVAFDAAAQVYIATSPTVRGLVVEAGTLDEIRSTVEQILPELLRLNRLDRAHSSQTHLHFDASLNPV